MLKKKDKRDGVTHPKTIEDIMVVRLNEDKEIVKMIREGLEKTGGYCPCRLERTEENKCVCQEFRQQIADPGYKGYCHCMLYYKD